MILFRSSRSLFIVEKDIAGDFWTAHRFRIGAVSVELYEVVRAATATECERLLLEQEEPLVRFSDPLDLPIFASDGMRCEWFDPKSKSPQTFFLWGDDVELQNEKVWKGKTTIRELITGSFVSNFLAVILRKLWGSESIPLGTNRIVSIPGRN